jgi:hypothetical protein
MRFGKSHDSELDINYQPCRRQGAAAGGGDQTRVFRIGVPRAFPSQEFGGQGETMSATPVPGGCGVARSAGPVAVHVRALSPVNSLKSLES